MLTPRFILGNYIAVNSLSTISVLTDTGNVCSLKAHSAIRCSSILLHKLNTEKGPHGRLKARKHQEVFLDTSTWSTSGYSLSDPGFDSTMDPATRSFKSHSHPGIPKPPGSTYTRVMVVARMKNDDISWIAHELPDTDVIAYVAIDPKAPRHSPKNKDHEVMTYLTYIVDHYDDLLDITIFMHAHRWTHHNNHLLGHDAVEMVPPYPVTTLLGKVV